MFIILIFIISLLTKLRAIDLLINESINKQFRDLKPGTTLNKNDFEKLSLKDLWRMSFQKQDLNNDLDKLKEKVLIIANKDHPYPKENIFTSEKMTQSTIDLYYRLFNKDS